MKKLSFGEIVLLKFPYTNEKIFKRRPALVIKDLNDRDIIVCRITSQIYNTPYDIYINEWETLGLKLPSVVRVHKLATLEKDMVELIFGEIDNNLKNKIKVTFTNLVE